MGSDGRNESPFAARKREDQERRAQESAAAAPEEETKTQDLQLDALETGLAGSKVRVGGRHPPTLTLLFVSALILLFVSTTS